MRSKILRKLAPMYLSNNTYYWIDLMQELDGDGVQQSTSKNKQSLAEKAREIMINCPCIDNADERLVEDLSEWSKAFSFTVYTLMFPLIQFFTVLIVSSNPPCVGLHVTYEKMIGNGVGNGRMDYWRPGDNDVHHGNISVHLRCICIAKEVSAQQNGRAGVHSTATLRDNLQDSRILIRSGEMGIPNYAISQNQLLCTEQQKAKRNFWQRLMRLCTPLTCGVQCGQESCSLVVLG